MPTHPSKKEQKNKLPYVALQRIKSDMTDSQKRGAEIWNLMVNTLIENDLMHEKSE